MSLIVVVKMSDWHFETEGKACIFVIGPFSLQKETDLKDLKVPAYGCRNRQYYECQSIDQKLLSRLGTKVHCPNHLQCQPYTLQRPRAAMLLVAIQTSLFVLHQWSKTNLEIINQWMLRAPLRNWCNQNRVRKNSASPRIFLFFQ